MPLSSVFAHEIEVGDSDIDFLGHASNLSYLRWVQDVAIAHSAAVGLTYEAYQKLGGVFFIRRHEIDYLRPALRGDRLEVRTWVDSAMAAKTERRTDVVRLSDGKMLASANTTWGFVNTTGRPVRIPKEVWIAFTKRDDDAGEPT
ncbi:MAG TPA: acyl-CoA thioesterase [Polyangiaceae bacterium]